jgi:hypothetical protein
MCYIVDRSLQFHQIDQKLEPKVVQPNSYMSSTCHRVRDIPRTSCVLAWCDIGIDQICTVQRLNLCAHVCKVTSLVAPVAGDIWPIVGLGVCPGYLDIPIIVG